MKNENNFTKAYSKRVNIFIPFIYIINEQQTK